MKKFIIEDDWLHVIDITVRLNLYFRQKIL